MLRLRDSGSAIRDAARFSFFEIEPRPLFFINLNHRAGLCCTSLTRQRRAGFLLRGRVLELRDLAAGRAAWRGGWLASHPPVTSPATHPGRFSAQPPTAPADHALQPRSASHPPAVPTPRLRNSKTGAS